MPPRVPPIILTGFWLGSGLAVLGYTVRAYLDTAGTGGGGKSPGGPGGVVGAVTAAGRAEIESDTNPKKNIVTKVGQKLFDLLRGK